MTHALLLQEQLPSHQPRFIVYSYKMVHDDRVSYPMCFIFFTPRDSMVRLTVSGVTLKLMETFDFRWSFRFCTLEANFFSRKKPILLVLTRLERSKISPKNGFVLRFRCIREFNHQKTSQSLLTILPFFATMNFKTKTFKHKTLCRRNNFLATKIFEDFLRAPIWMAKWSIISFLKFKVFPLKIDAFCARERPWDVMLESNF